MICSLRPALIALASAVALPLVAAPVFARDAAPAAPVLAPTAIVASANDAGHPKKKAKSKKRKPFVQLNLSLEKSYAIGADQIPPQGALNDNEIMPAGSLTLNLTPRLRLVESRLNHFSIGGRRYKGAKNTPSFSGLGYDIEYRTTLAYALAKDLELSEAYAYRWRTCCPGAGDPLNNKPRLRHELITGLTYKFGPNTVVGKPLQVHVEAAINDHHLDLGTGLPAGTPVLGRALLGKETFYSQVPAFGKNFVPYFGFEHFTSIFDNQLVPSTINRSIFGFRINGNSFMSYRAYVKNDHETNPGGNVSHKVSLYLETTFKFHS